MTGRQTKTDPKPDPRRVSTLANGARVLTLALAEGATGSVSLYFKRGSAHERAAENGIAHALEHLVFKGTKALDRRALNRRAEALGAEVNAHTDKDHTAFHMRGLAVDAPSFIEQLAEIVREATIPADELEREREVLLQEFIEDEDDPVSTAFKLFDRACHGLHPAAQPVIGSRTFIERMTRADLLRWRDEGYTAANLVIAAALPRADHEAIVRVADAALGDLRRGTPNRLEAPPWVGGQRSRGQAGSSQSHLVLGLPAAAREEFDALPELAAALLGEGMSSPLMEELREQRGLAYYAACSADALEGYGQFVIEASMAPARLDEALQLIVHILRAAAEVVDAGELQRARRQLLVRRARLEERPQRHLESVALGLLCSGRLPDEAAWIDAVETATPTSLRDTFLRMIAAPPALAVAGAVPRGHRARAQAALEALTKGR